MFPIYREKPNKEDNQLKVKSLLKKCIVISKPRQSHIVKVYRTNKQRDKISYGVASILIKALLEFSTYNTCEAYTRTKSNLWAKDL